MTDRPPPPQPSRERPRLLLITEFFPDSPRAVYGAFQRLRNHISALRELGCVDIVFLWPERGGLAEVAVAEHTARAREALGFDGEARFVPVALARKQRDWLLDLGWACRGAISFFRKRPSMHSTGRMQALNLRRIVSELSPDLVFAHRVGAGALLLRTGIDACPIILDMDDIEHVSLMRGARSANDWLRKWAGFAFSLVARFAERRVSAICSCVLVCSELDRGRLIEVAPRANVSVVRNSATAFRQLAEATSPTAIFVGMGHYPPNQEAILWLAHDIWPRVVSELPDARLLIIGEGSKTLPISSTAKNIEVLDFLPELDGVYGRARLVTCPVRRGSGTRIKIIEAALNGRAVVSTSVGAEGLLFEDGSQILLADDAETFAQRCVEVLGNPQRAAVLGLAAQQRAREIYSQESVRSELVSLCRRFIAATATSGTSVHSSSEHQAVSIAGDGSAVSAASNRLASGNSASSSGNP